MSDEFTLVTAPDALREAVERLREAPFLAMDTEFIRERTYFPRLCLVQIADADAVYLVDPFAVGDLSPLCDLLRAPMVKVFHAARQDLEVFWWRLGVLPRPLFDTQVAAAYLGLGDQLGYGELVRLRRGVELPKGETRSDWAARPLSPRQLQYAAADVRHLADLYPALRDELNARGRLGWVLEDCERALDPRFLEMDPESAWLKVKGRQRLRGEALAVLVVLAAWRERAAREADLPRRRLASDELLVDLARLRPRRPADFARLRGVREDWLRRHGASVVAAVAEGVARGREGWPGGAMQKGRLEPAEERLVDALMVALAEAAAAMEISPALLASRRDLQRLVRGEQDVPLLSGWRWEYGGRAVLDFLRGHGRLVVREGRLALEGDKQAP